MTTQRGSLNLRESPSASAKVLRTIPQYETIPILEKGTSWCKTVYGGDTGYVMIQFLTFSGSSAGAAAAHRISGRRLRGASMECPFASTMCFGLKIRSKRSGFFFMMCSSMGYASLVFRSSFEGGTVEPP